MLWILTMFQTPVIIDDISEGQSTERNIKLWLCQMT